MLFRSAGDYVTGTLRELWQTRYGAAGPGFVLASKAWPTYIRNGWRIGDAGWKSSSYVFASLKSGRYGPGGVALEAAGGSASQVSLETALKSACEVQFFHQLQPGGGKLKLKADKRAFAEVNTDAEARLAVVKQAFDACPRQLTVEVPAGRSAQVYGWNVEVPQGGVLWSSMGVISARSTHLTAYDAGHAREAIATLSPDLLVLAYDLNLASVADFPPASYEIGRAHV